MNKRLLRRILIPIIVALVIVILSLIVQTVWALIAGLLPEGTAFAVLILLVSLWLSGNVAMLVVRWLSKESDQVVAI